MRKKFICLVSLVLAACFLLIGCKNEEDKGNSLTDNTVKIADLTLNSYYRIVNKDSGKYIDGKDYTAENTNVVQWSDSTKKSQIWKITPSDQEGLVYIVNMSTNKAFSKAEDNSSNKLVQRNFSNEGNQLFTVIKQKDGYYSIQSKDGKCVDSYNKKNDGAALMLNEKNDEASQMWKFEEEIIYDDLTAMYIVSKSNGSVLSVSDFEYNSGILFSEKEEKFNNEWFIIKESSAFILKNLYSAKVLISDENGKPVVGSRTEESKEWLIEKDKDDYFIIKNKKSELVLTYENKKLVLKESNKKDEQLFKIEQVNPEYAVPEPKPLKTGKYLVGTIACNLWDETTRPNCWNQMKPYPERTPFIGYYKEGSPKSVDWEIKAAVDNGIGLFFLCWYRPNENVGKPVVPLYDHWIKGLKQSKYKDMVKYMIMFTNNDKDLTGNFKDEADLLNNLMPYWMENYFKDSNYLTIDGKPVLDIYNFTTFTDALGGVDKAKITIQKMRKMMTDAGFKGIVLYSQFCWGNPEAEHTNLKDMGFEGLISYAIPTFATGALPANQMTFTDEEILAGHKYYWERQSKAAVPYIPTVAMGFDSTPWNNSISHKKWRLTPGGFKNVLSAALDFQNKKNSNATIDRIILLDNWNEYGEGHYINPTEIYGFGYLEAVAQVFGEK